MDSLRHPVGPLPSSIYWRRRAVVFCLLALVVALIVWIVVSSTSGDGGSEANGDDGRRPPATITPSPGPSDPPAVTERPGGSGGSGGEDDDGDSDGSGGPGQRDSGGADDLKAPDRKDGGTGEGGARADSARGGGNQPARASMPSCTPSRTDVTVRSAKNTYKAGDKPRFELVVSNESEDACKVDFGQRATVLTITKTSDNERVWSSGDCPENKGADLVQVPAGGHSQRGYEWDRERTVRNCASPSSGATKVGAGTYLVEARVPGIGTARVSFVIERS